MVNDFMTQVDAAMNRVDCEPVYEVHANNGVIYQWLNRTAVAELVIDLYKAETGFVVYRDGVKCGGM